MTPNIRHFFLKIYFMCRLYILGFLEMFIQPFERVILNDTSDNRDCVGKVAFITGGTAGIGLSVSKIFCRMGMTVFAAGPLYFQPQSLTSELQGYIDEGKLHYICLRLESFKSIEDAADKFISKSTDLDYVINNAGVMLTPYFETKQGFEGHIGVNFFGHVKLTKLLLPKLNATRPLGDDKRIIINVASSVHQVAPVSLLLSGRFFSNPPFYSAHLSYALSKLAIILYTECLADHLEQLGSSVLVQSVHPGVVASSLYRHVCTPLRLTQQYMFSPFLFRTVDEGAIAIVNCALSKTACNGSYVQSGLTSYLPYVSRADKQVFWKIVGQRIHKCFTDQNQ